MKILYIAPENVSGGFMLFAEGHRKRGNECRWITFFRDQYGFSNDLCFNLFGMPLKPWVRLLRRVFNRVQSKPDLPELKGSPPVWRPTSLMEEILYWLRDLINAPRIRNAIAKWQLNDYDIYHFEQGLDPFRNGRWIKELAARGKGLVAFYHGTDLRNRGVISAVNTTSKLNLTSEIDLLDRLPGMKYLYLPIDIARLPAKVENDSDIIRIGHAARNRELKGSDRIEAVVANLQHKYNVDFLMIENVNHEKGLEIKARCDIFVDQITDMGGWGYGASSVESLAMGIPTLTLINPRVAEFLGDHPFVSVTPETLESELIKLIEDTDRRKSLAEFGLKWVRERHGIDAVMDTLYGYYSEVGLI